MIRILSIWLLVQTILFSQTAMRFREIHPHAFSQNQQNKIYSGFLLRSLNDRLQAASRRTSSSEPAVMQTILYFQDYPSALQIDSMNQLGIEIFPGTWTRPSANHPLGFVVATIPTTSFEKIIQLSFLKKIDSAEELSNPLNNEAAKKIYADSAWSAGWTGNGIRIAILDSGLDTDPTNDDLPASITKRDYSKYPTSIDDTVENTVTAHGTHVTGSVLGRGTLSAGNTGNGGGSYKGIAYEASLIFLKIGKDGTGGATSAAEIAAMHAAVDTFHAQIVSMSYGSWNTYHDGSESLEQAADWVYGKGVPFFIAAGNDGTTARHYSGTVAAHDSSEFIQVNVASAGTNDTPLFFNLVWSDGSDRSNLTLKYYDNTQTPYTAYGVDSTTESSRGTESQLSSSNDYLPSGSATYYLRVINPSAHSQTYHIYESWGNSKVKFNSSDPYYTVAAPSTADHAFSVSSFNTRASWTDYNNSSWNNGNTVNDISPFASRGPRIDGTQKPNITAPGSVIISIRDRDVLTSADLFWIDNDGSIPGGNANYYVMQGTSMATPVCAGAAALLLQKDTLAYPSTIYTALANHTTTDSYTGSVPNSTWGYGKVNVQSAMTETLLPVELTTFSASVEGNKILLEWETATEINNYGFSVERKIMNSGNVQSEEWQSIGFVHGNGYTNAAHHYAFTDSPSGSVNSVQYRLKQIDSDGKYTYSNVVTANMRVANIIVHQNFPNPFNPVTTINFEIPTDNRITLAIYDAMGQQIAVILDDYKQAGRYSIPFNASGISSGVYFYKLTSGAFTAQKKMIILK